VEAVDPGDRGEEIAAVDLRTCRISAIAGMLEYDLDANSCLRVQW
jgi:hypothetical protein